MDGKLFRTLMGRFATGVTIVTAAGEDGRHGMTANAFSSVSLEPPLVLVCVDKGNNTYRWLQETRSFAVNFLSETQQDLSDRFAGRFSGEDPWDGLSFRPGKATGSPILDGTLGFVECRLEHLYEGGDHGIFVGRVLDGAVHDPVRPLLFYASRYRRLPENEPL